MPTSDPAASRQPAVSSPRHPPSGVRKRSSGWCPSTARRAAGGRRVRVAPPAPGRRRRRGHHRPSSRGWPPVPSAAAYLAVDPGSGGLVGLLFVPALATSRALAERLGFGRSWKAVLASRHAPILVDLKVARQWHVKGKHRMWCCSKVDGTPRITKCKDQASGADLLTCRDILLDHGVLTPLLSQSREDIKVPVLRTTTWALSNLCFGKLTSEMQRWKNCICSTDHHGVLSSKNR